MSQILKFRCEIIILLPTFISILEIIAIALTMAKRTDFVDRPAPVDGPDTKGCDPEYHEDLWYSGSQLLVSGPSTGAALSTKSVLLTMVSAIAMISRMLIICWDIRM